MTPRQRIRELRLKHATLVQELLRFDTAMTFATSPGELRRYKALSWNMHGQVARCNKSIDKLRRELRQGQRQEKSSDEESLVDLVPAHDGKENFDRTTDCKAGDEDWKKAEPILSKYFKPYQINPFQG